MKTQSLSVMKNAGHIAALLGITITLSACADFQVEPKRVDKHFGEAAKAVSAAQIANPKAAANPLENAPNLKNGEFGEKVMERYIKSGEQDKVVAPRINIGIGSGGSR